MTPRRANAFYARTLLAAALVWVFGVTVCSTRAVGMDAAAPHHDPGVAAGHDHHDEGAGHNEHGKSDECVCAAFNAFPIQLSSMLKAPVPAVALLYPVPLDEITFSSVASSFETQNTGPPERVALSERSMERCQLNHAPPRVG